MRQFFSRRASEKRRSQNKGHVESITASGSNNTADDDDAAAVVVSAAGSDSSCRRGSGLLPSPSPSSSSSLSPSPSPSSPSLVPEWDAEPVALKDFASRRQVPGLARVVKGSYLTIGASRFSFQKQHQDVFVHSVTAGVKVLARCFKRVEVHAAHRTTRGGGGGGGGKKTSSRLCATDQRLTVPLTYQGWFELLSEDGLSARPISGAAELVAVFPSRCLVREDVQGYVGGGSEGRTVSSDRCRTISAGEQLTLRREVSLPSSGQRSQARRRLLQCVDGRGDSVYLSLEQPGGVFTPIAQDGDVIGVLSVRDIIRRFRLPLTVKLVHGVRPRVSDSKFSGLIRLDRLYTEDTAFVCPLEKKHVRLLPVPCRSVRLQLVAATNHQELSASPAFWALQVKCSQMVTSYNNSLHLAVTLPDSVSKNKASGISSIPQPSTTSGAGGSAGSRSQSSEDLLMDEIDDLYAYVRDGGDPPPTPQARGPQQHAWDDHHGHWEEEEEGEEEEGEEEEEEEEPAYEALEQFRPIARDGGQQVTNFPDLHDPGQRTGALLAERRVAQMAPPAPPPPVAAAARCGDEGDEGDERERGSEQLKTRLPAEDSPPPLPPPLPPRRAELAVPAATAGTLCPAAVGTAMTITTTTTHTTTNIINNNNTDTDTITTTTTTSTTTTTHINNNNTDTTTNINKNNNNDTNTITTTTTTAASSSCPSVVDCGPHTPMILCRRASAPLSQSSRSAQMFSDGADNGVLQTHPDSCSTTDCGVLQTHVDPCSTTDCGVLQTHADPCSATDCGVLQTHADPCSTTDCGVMQTHTDHCNTDNGVQQTHANPCSTTDCGVLQTNADPCSTTDNGVQRTHADPCSTTDCGVLQTHPDPCSTADNGVQQTHPDPCSTDCPQTLPPDKPSQPAGRRPKRSDSDPSLAAVHTRCPTTPCSPAVAAAREAVSRSVTMASSDREDRLRHGGLGLPDMAGREAGRSASSGTDRSNSDPARPTREVKGSHSSSRTKASSSPASSGDRRSARKRLQTLYL